MKQPETLGEFWRYIKRAVKMQLAFQRIRAARRKGASDELA